MSCGRDRSAPGTETSPIVSGHTVYYGDQGGTLYSRNVATGHLYWAYHASGAIKGGPALVNGVLYFGDYAGRAYAVRAVNGRQVWAVSTSGAALGFGSGNFYSTPAVAYRPGLHGQHRRPGLLVRRPQRGTGLGDLDRRLRLRISGRRRSEWVGADRLRRLLRRPHVRVQRPVRRVRWSHPAGGRISGAATVVGNAVYFSDLGSKTTIGLDAVTGRRCSAFPTARSTRSSPTTTPSTSTATTRSTRCSRPGRQGPRRGASSGAQGAPEARHAKRTAHRARRNKATHS